MQDVGEDVAQGKARARIWRMPFGYCIQGPLFPQQAGYLGIVHAEGADLSRTAAALHAADGVLPSSAR